MLLVCLFVDKFDTVVASPVGEGPQPLEPALQTGVPFQHGLDLIRISRNDDRHSLVHRIGHGCNQSCYCFFPEVTFAQLVSLVDEKNPAPRSIQPKQHNAKSFKNLLGRFDCHGSQLTFT